jgi:hypothetical protein
MKVQYFHGNPIITALAKLASIHSDQNNGYIRSIQKLEEHDENNRRK